MTTSGVAGAGAQTALGTALAVARRKQNFLNWLLLAPALVVLGFALLIPLFFVFKNSIFPADQPEFSLFYFQKFLTDQYYLDVLWRTFRVGMVATLLTLVPGYVLAYNMTLHPNARWRTVVMAITLVPLVVNLVIRVYGWMTILSLNGILNNILEGLGLIDTPLRILFTESAIAIGFIHSHLYFMVLPIAGALMKMDPDLLRASENLGATPLKTFVNVILPLSVPGILSGCLLVFALNISDFVAPSLLGGNRYQMMTYLVYEQQLYLANESFAAAATVILMAAAAIALAGALWVASLFGRRFGA